ncbi:LrgB family protein [Nocardioides lianchengensis]|uniref:TIGR00659 family protein n=1 Tax=Nocardioides lianchengensis TaxID=1045774 RepID=A0A1G6TVU5_9ACTN|nr:LrgB family protein [Nocardioides lianchengensis]NYG11640.1 putative murein hydrolase (TIGR00659 family) [Nocardioides lianchengensis]SDD32576.1 TIGR00659 family protein [Nocardioides lianchengensis]
MSWLTDSPLFPLVLTLLAYQAGRSLQARTGHALAQPVLVAVVLVGAVLLVLDVDVADYRDGTALLTFLLGPATVALAVPLHRQAHRLRGLLVPLLVAVPLGALVSVGSAVLVARGLGGDELLQRTLAPKAATAPVSIALSGENGGIPQLTAALTIVAGILGAVAGPAVLTLLRVRSRTARGIAMGSVSHGIGTSRALAEDRTEGAFSGLAMGLIALATSLVLPILLALLL